MKITDYVIIALVVGMCFTSFGLIIGDLKEQYPDVSINDSGWEGKYNFTDEINDSAYVLQVQLQKIGDATNFWTTISAGALALPKVVISVADILLLSMQKGTIMFSGMLNSLSVPMFVQIVGVIIILITVIFAGVSFYHRAKA